jgi:ubiquinone/menaquinone biosynthesis C-methylase UbiE
MNTNFNRFLAQQLGDPSGPAGRVIFSVMNRQNHSLYEATEQLLSLQAGERVLDIGCGNGNMIARLAIHTKADFTGIDISESILASARKKNRLLIQAGTARFELGSADSMNFGDANFDKACTINTVYFWNDLNATFSEIRRVLRPKATFVNTFYTNETLSKFGHTRHGYTFWDQDDLHSAARAADFEVELVSIADGAACSMVCKAV